MSLRCLLRHLPVLVVSASAIPAPGAESPPWVAMDYGPFLSATIGSSGPGPTHASNLTHKAIAVNLGGPPGRNAAVVFDTDLLRYSVGWTGNFVALKGVAFDGEHWAHPLIDGRPAFANPVAPGWARPGTVDFADGRSEPYGPLSRDWVDWKGIHVHGTHVVFEYRIGDMTVLDRPGVEWMAENPYFVRTLDLGASTTEQTLQVLAEPGRRAIPLPESGVSDAGEPFPATDRSGVWLQSPMIKRAAKAMAPPTEGLLGWWDFDGSEPTAFDDRSGTGRELRRDSARLVQDGRSGGALTFEPKQRAGIAGAADLNFASRDLTFSAWIRTREDGGIFAKTAPGPEWVRGGVALFVRNGRLGFDVGWVGSVGSSRPVADGEWHHVALTWRASDGSASLYVDGQPDGSARLAPPQPLADHVAWLGFVAPNFPASPWFRGSLDDVRIYGRALRPLEVDALAGPPPRDASVPAVGIVGAPAGTRWLATGETGNVRLLLPAHGNPIRLKLLLWRTLESEVAQGASALAMSPAPETLSESTRPGPARWPEKLETRGRLAGDDGPYAIDELTAPDANPWNSWLRFSGIDLFRDGTTAAVSTWNGDVWRVSGVEGSLERLTWQRIAAGLYQPLGLRIVDDEIYVLGRDQITRLRDTNGDGETDFYENFNNDARVGEHFHEFANDLKQGPDGDFYYVKCARHALPAAHSQHGTLIRVSRDGRRSEVVARGFRAVNGLGVGPGGELTTVDNQGHWMPANRINWVKPGGWYGNTWAWNPDQRTTYDDPLCWVHNFVDRSGGTHLWVPTDRWGLSKHDLITLSYGMGHAFLILRDDVGGVMQGALTRLPLDFETGVMRGVFHPDNGQLYACGLYGWAGNRTKPGGFYRIRRTERPLHVANRFHAARDGLVLGFTQPLDRSTATDPGNYDVKAWNYRWSAQYGSPDLRLDGSEGRDTWRVESATVAADGLSVFLKVPDVRPVMQIHLTFKLRSADGTPVENFVHGTVHRIAAEPGLADLGPDPIGRTSVSEVRLHEEAAGLRQSLYVGEETTPRDVRRSRLAAFHLPAGAVPGPFLSSGLTRVRWDGWLKLDLNETVEFEAECRGSFRLTLDGQEVLAQDADGGSGRRTRPLTLRRGFNRFDLEYRPPLSGDAEFRLRWIAASHPSEPVPATAFVHDASDGLLRRFADLRTGRDLFAQHQCAACHLPRTPWNVDAMPELSASATALDGIGDRLNAEWMARWLTAPRQLRADARMPVLLHGTGAGADAGDIAAYLGSLRKNVPAGDDTPGSAETGATLYRELGCAACHALPGETPMEPETRLGLGETRSKWRPGALAAYLRAPTRLHAWSRMPDFGLSRTEADDLAAFLVERSSPPMLPPVTGGEIVRGAEKTTRLGCLRCHTLEGVKDSSRAPELATIARVDGLRGCLATNPRDRRTAPDFGFDDDQRGALRRFLTAEPDALLRRDSPIEFSARQYRDLQCNACHARDNEGDRLATLDPDRAGPISDDEESIAGGSVHVGRPILTHVGEKLHAPWTERLLSGSLGYKPRSDLRGRMPAFPAYATGLASGLAHEHGYGVASVPAWDVDTDFAEIGRKLTLVEGGFSCISCHGVGTQKALAGKDTATVNFAHVGDRLRDSYYWRYVQDPPRVMPGTMMPKFLGDDGRTSIKSVLGGDPRLQFEAIWHYLHSVRGRATQP